MCDENGTEIRRLSLEEKVWGGSGHLSCELQHFYNVLTSWNMNEAALSSPSFPQLYYQVQCGLSVLLYSIYISSQSD